MQHKKDNALVENMWQEVAMQLFSRYNFLTIYVCYSIYVIVFNLVLQIYVVFLIENLH